MKIHSIIIALVIGLSPFIIGTSLYMFKGGEETYKKAHFISDTRKDNKGIDYKGIKIDWSFCPDWEYKPLLFPAEKYLVFMFHYRNDNEYSVQLMPSYTFVPPAHRRYPANEEISMYIEDELEDELKTEDETPITFELSPGITKHYIVTFEKPRSLAGFYIDMDIFRDVTVRIYYKKENGFWSNYKNELVNEYKGRG